MLLSDRQTHKQTNTIPKTQNKMWKYMLIDEIANNEFTRLYNYTLVLEHAFLQSHLLLGEFSILKA